MHPCMPPPRRHPTTTLKGQCHSQEQRSRPLHPIMLKHQAQAIQAPQAVSAGRKVTRLMPGTTKLQCMQQMNGSRRLYSLGPNISLIQLLHLGQLHLCQPAAVLLCFKALAPQVRPHSHVLHTSTQGYSMLLQPSSCEACTPMHLYVKHFSLPFLLCDIPSWHGIEID